jgi:hypothetical protein
MHELSVDDLFYILDDCEELSGVIPLLSKQQAEELLTYFTQHRPQQLLKDDFAYLSIIDAIDISSIPVDLLWALVSLISFGAAAMWISLATAALTLCIGTGYFIYSYRDYRDKLLEREHFFRLASLKNSAADEIIIRFSNTIPEAKLAEAKLSSAHQSLIPQHKGTIVSARGAFLLGGATIVALFGTFFWGTAEILEILGYTSASTDMTGTIGLIIAGMVTLVIGIYVGYQYYQLRKNLQEIKTARAEINNIIQKKRHHCADLKAVAMLTDGPTFFGYKQLAKPETILATNNSIDFEESTSTVTVK